MPMTTFIISIISAALGLLLGRYLSQLKFEKSTAVLEERQRLSDAQQAVLERKLQHAVNEKEETRTEK